jgi:hypothetical protein
MRPLFSSTRLATDRLALWPVDEIYNRSRQLRPESAVEAAAAASLSPDDLLHRRMERARPSSLDALAEATLADLFGPPHPGRCYPIHAPRGPGVVAPSTEEGLVTEEWRDAVCDAVLHEMAR